MKRISWLFSCVFAAVVATSCGDYLDKTPDDDMTIDEVFTNPDWARAWLYNCYSWLPNEANFADDGAFRSPFIFTAYQCRIMECYKYIQIPGMGTVLLRY